MERRNLKQRNPKVKTFLVFLGLAIVFWFLTKFSKDTKATIQAHLQYTNVPANTLLSQRNPKEISFDITANGFQLLFYAIKDTKVRLDLEKFTKVDATHIHISQQELVSVLKRELGASEIENLSPNELSIYLDKTVSKKVPIIFQETITYKDGFRPLAEAKLVPDSIQITGPSESIQSIESVKTKLFNKKGLDQTLTARIDLLPLKNGAVTMDPTSVEVQIAVAEFTQKELSVPIEVLNVPEDTTLKILPETVMLKFEVAVSEFNSIKPADFRVVCDFSEKITEGNFMIPKIVNQPNGIHRIEITPKKLEYLIFK